MARTLAFFNQRQERRKKVL